LKARLPLGKKAKDEDEEFEEHEDDSDSSRNDDATDATDLSALEDEEGEEEEEELSIVDKIKKKIKSFQKKSSKDDEDEEESEASAEEDDEEAKKKKKSKIIQIAIGVALVVFLLSDYIFPPEEPVTSEGTEEIIQEPKAETPQVTDAKSEPATEEPVTATPDTPADPSDETETPPDSPVEVTSIESPDQVTEPETTPPVTDISTTTDTETEPQPDLSLDSPDTVSDIPIEETPGESGEDIVGEDMSQGTDENLTDQILQDLEKQAKGTTKAEPKKEYVAPPDYEYRGRGLVYNCTGKHWACVDAPSYKTCEDNASSVRYLKKAVECHPFNVYETTKGCESMQNRMVSSSAKTTFCNE